MEEEIKKFIVHTLMLEDIQPEDIDTDAALFGEGLGLDSVDALELGVALQKKYGMKISGKSEENRVHFASVKNLAAYVAANRIDQD